MSRWNWVDRPDLTGRTALITGASSGVGRATAFALAEAGAHTVLGVRDLRKGEEVAAAIQQAIVGASVEVERIDLASLRSIEAAVDRLRSTRDRLDLLVNNGAVAAIPRQETEDGFEMQVGVNHLGHFALVGRLLPLLLASNSGRVVTVTSGVARRARLDLGDLQSTERYSRYDAYTKAKTANLLFALGLDRRLRALGASTVSVSAQPGWTRSNLGPGRSAGVLERAAIAIGNALVGHDAAQGAQPILLAATGAMHGGEYVTPRALNGLKGRPVVVGRSDLPADDATIEGLWDRSEQLTGVTFPDALPADPPADESSRGRAKGGAK